MQGFQLWIPVCRLVLYTVDWSVVATTFYLLLAPLLLSTNSSVIGRRHEIAIKARLTRLLHFGWIVRGCCTISLIAWGLIHCLACDLTNARRGLAGSRRSIPLVSKESPMQHTPLESPAPQVASCRSIHPQTACSCLSCPDLQLPHHKHWFHCKRHDKWRLTSRHTILYRYSIYEYSCKSSLLWNPKYDKQYNIKFWNHVPSKTVLLRWVSGQLLAKKFAYFPRSSSLIHGCMTNDETTLILTE